MEQKNLLSKGIDVLEILKEKENSISFVELQRELNIPKTTLYRILKTLIERKLVIYENKKYKLGYGFLQFTKRILSEIPLREIANPYLKKICEKTGETAELIIPDGDAILYIDKIESPQSIKLFSQIGSRYETLHASAPGKILLAYDNIVFERYMKKREFIKITKKTIVDKEKIKEEIKRIKKRGWSFDIGEARIDVVRIAGPVINYEGKLTGIVGIAGPCYRIKGKKIEEFGKMIKEICEDISKKIGYEGG